MNKEIREMAEIVLKASERFYGTTCSKECADNEAIDLYEAGYRKQEPIFIPTPIESGCAILCNTEKVAIKEFAEKLQQVIDKAELVVQKMHSKYHLTFGAEQKAYSNAYNATVAIRECIENLKKEYGVE